MSAESLPAKQVRGKVFKFGDSINTDIIYPGRFMPVTDPEEMAKHAFQGVSDDTPMRRSRHAYRISQPRCRHCKPS